jgi:hypothetical protein
MQQTGQTRSSSRQTRHDSSNRYLGYCSYLGVRAGLKLTQNDRLSEKGRKLINRFANSLLNVQSLYGHVGLLAMIDQLWSDDIYRDHVRSLRAIRAVRREAHSPDDCQKPGTRIFIAERRKISDGPENGFLHRVFRVGLVAREVHRESEARGQVWKYCAFKAPRFGSFSTPHFYCLGSMT